MKRYVVKDEDGKAIEVNEYEEGEMPEKETKPMPEEGTHDEAFSPEQVDAIKKIVAEAIAEALKKDEPAAGPDVEAHDESIEASKEDNGDGGAIGSVQAPAKDSISKKGPGSVEVHDSKVEDSIIDEGDEEINKAWASRFN